MAADGLVLSAYQMKIGRALAIQEEENRHYQRILGVKKC